MHGYDVDEALIYIYLNCEMGFKDLALARTGVQRAEPILLKCIVKLYQILENLFCFTNYNIHGGLNGQVC